MKKISNVRHDRSMLIINAIVPTLFSLSFSASLPIFAVCYFARNVVSSVIVFKSCKATVCMTAFYLYNIFYLLLIVAEFVRRKTPPRFHNFYFGWIVFYNIMAVWNCYNFFYQMNGGHTYGGPISGWILFLWYFSPCYFWLKDMMQKDESAYYSELDYYGVIVFLSFGACIFFDTIRVTTYFPGFLVNKYREVDFIIIFCSQIFFTITVTGMESR